MKYPEKFYSKKILLGSNALYISYKDWDHTPSEKEIAEQEKALEKHRCSLERFIKTINGEGKTLMYLDKKLIPADDFLKHCHS